MATYNITDPSTGIKVKLSGDSPPTEKEIIEILSKVIPQKVEESPINKPEQPSSISRFGIGMGYGMEQGALGIAQRLAEMQGPADSIGGIPATGNALLDSIKAKIAQNRQAYAPLQQHSEESPWYSPTAQGMGQAIGQTGVTALLQPPVVRGGVIANAAVQGAVQGFLQPTVGNESVGANTLTGGALGAVTGGTLAGGGKLTNPVVTKIQGISNKYKIPITTGEAGGSPFLQGIEHLQEKIPLLGIGNFRVKQNQAASEAAKLSLAKYAKGQDPLNSITENRAFASNLYEEMKGLLPRITEQKIEPIQTQSIATNFLKQYPEIFKRFQDTKTETLLKDVASGVKNISINDPLDVLSNLYNMPTGSKSFPTTLTFDELWTLRQGLGEKIGQARKAFARGEIDETAYGQFKKLFGAVSSDLENWANKIGKPEIVDAFRAANDAYKNNVVKYDILQRAYEKAAGPNENVGRMFSPQKFSTALIDIVKKDKAYKLFQPNEIAEISGLANIMHVAERAGQYMARPETGAKLTLPVLSGALAEIAHTAGIPTDALGYTLAAEGGILGITKFLTSTGMGKRLVLSASKIEPTSPTMRNIMMAVYTMAPRVAAQEGVGNK